MLGRRRLDGAELAELERRFEREIFPVLTPLASARASPFPYISPLSLSLGVFARDPETGEERFARVKVPEGLPRFLPVGARPAAAARERDRALPDRLFPGMEIVERAVFRVTRDADFEVSDEADDLLEAVEFELRKRRFGDVVRLEVSSSMSSAMLDGCSRGSACATSRSTGHGPLDLADPDQIARSTGRS